MKRLQIPLSEEAIATYEAYADALDTTVPKALNATLEASLPGVREITKHLIDFRKAQGTAIDGIEEVMKDMLKDLNQQRIG